MSDDVVKPSQFTARQRGNAFGKWSQKQLATLRRMQAERRQSAERSATFQPANDNKPPC